MKLILDFEYLQLPLDDEPKRETIFSVSHIPNIGDTVRWQLKGGELYYKVTDRNFNYNNSLLESIVCFLKKEE